MANVVLVRASSDNTHFKSEDARNSARVNLEARLRATGLKVIDDIEYELKIENGKYRAKASVRAV